MSKATIKNLIPLFLLPTLLFLFSCSSPEEKRAKLEITAKTFVAQGDYAEALLILEDLATIYPNDIEILTAIGQAHAKSGDPSMAAFFLEQAQLQAPKNTELLYQAYEALSAAGQPTGTKLIQLSELAPQRMTDELWIELGAHYAQLNQIERALKAYLTGADLDENKPDSETSVAIGQLFISANNLPQAEKWFDAAAEKDDVNALTALFGLLDIQLRQKRWADAEKTIAHLDTKFPGAVDASEWKQAREELTQWREAQERMKAKLAKVTAEKQAAEEARKAKASLAAQPEEPTEATSEGKTQIIADLDAAEVMADMPALEPEAKKISVATAAYDPDIAIEPADPSLTFSVEFDEEDRAPETAYSISEQNPEVSEPVNLVAPPAPEPHSFEELLADAETAEVDRNFKDAISKYWSAIGLTNDRADVWNRLSRAYLVDGQLKNAETAALEAIRLEPSQVSYTLDYLRVAQRSRPPKEFLSQLETAYDRFPANAELTLSLARTHERISRDGFTARNLYQRFIDLAPNHPLVQEARDAIVRLR